MTKAFTLVSLVLSLACLSVGWGMVGFWPVSLACLVLLLIGLLPVSQKLQFFPDLLLVFTVLGAALGLLLHVGFSLALTAVISGLAAWDLQHFTRQLAFASDEDNPGLIERGHFRRIGLVLLGGVGIIFLSRSISFGFGFDWTLLLAILAFFGLSALVYGLSSEE